MILTMIFTGDFEIQKVLLNPSKNFNQTKIIIHVYLKRSISKSFTYNFIPTLALLMIVHFTFYFPEDNLQMRAMCVLSCFLILSTILTNDVKRGTSEVTLSQIWNLFSFSLTFFDVALQTIYGYYKQYTTSSQNGRKLIMVGNQNLVSNHIVDANRKAMMINYWGGKIFSPAILGVFTFIYFSVAYVNYNVAEDTIMVD